MGGKLFEWAFSILGGAPPMQNVAALLVIIFLAVPLLFDGIRKFKDIAGINSSNGLPRIESIAETPLLIQTITRIHVELEGLREDISRLITLVDHLLNNQNDNHKN